ncbi:tropinone reductase-like protein 3 [Tanacetum coccineum]
MRTPYLLDLTFPDVEKIMSTSLGVNCEVGLKPMFILFSACNTAEEEKSMFQGIYVCEMVAFVLNFRNKKCFEAKPKSKETFFDEDYFVVLITGVASSTVRLHLIPFASNSFNDKPIKEESLDSMGKELFEKEQDDLLVDLIDIPKKACDRRINEFVKRARAAKIHAYIISQLKKEMPAVMGKSKTQQKLMKNLEDVFAKVQKEFHLPPGDFPDVEHFRQVLGVYNIDKFEKLKPKMIQAACSEGASVVYPSRRQRNVDEAVKKLKQQGIEVLGVESTLDKLWEIDIKTAILLLQDASPHLTKGSSMVFISSLSAFQPPSSMAMYGVTKTALPDLTKALATEMAPHTRVNCVAPGTVPTHFASFITDNDTIRNAIEEKTPLKRLGTPEDMAAATAFLASDEASYITGETIVVAGGMSSRLRADGIGRLSSPCGRAAGVSFSLSGRAVSDGSSPCGRAAGIGCDSSPCALTVGDGSSPCRRAADIGSLTIRTLTVANFATGEKVCL